MNSFCSPLHHNPWIKMQIVAFLQNITPNKPPLYDTTLIVFCISQPLNCRTIFFCLIIFKGGHILASPIFLEIFFLFSLPGWSFSRWLSSTSWGMETMLMVFLSKIQLSETWYHPHHQQRRVHILNGDQWGSKHIVHFFYDN